MPEEEIKNGVLKMLSSDKQVMIDSILLSEESHDAVEYLIKKYAEESVENSRTLIRHISTVTDIAILHKEKEARMNYEATSWLVVQNSLNLEQDSNTLFAMMVPVCKAVFRNGTADGRSEAERKYFNKFLKLFNNKKVFSWEKDKDWADMYGYTDYLKLVESKNE